MRACSSATTDIFMNTHLQTADAHETATRPRLDSQIVAQLFSASGGAVELLRISEHSPRLGGFCT